MEESRPKNVSVNWKILNSSYPFACPWLTVRKDEVQLPNGITIPDFYVTEAPDWVNVIAITKEDKYIIEEQYRHGVQQVCFELCAGMVDEAESPLEAAKRELLEETGYAGGEWKAFGMSVPNASGSVIKCYHFIAVNVEYQHTPKPEHTEEIKIHHANESELKTMMSDGRMVEAVMLAPLWRFFENNHDEKK